MSDNSADILIQIKTAFETGGSDAALKKINELTGANKDAATSTALSASEANKAARANQLLTAALSGNVGALSRIISSGGDATAVFAKLSFVSAAFFAGWTAGNKIGDVLWPKILKLDEFDKTTDSIRGGIDKAIKSLEGMNSAKMTDLKKELQGILDTIDTINDDLSEQQDRQQNVLGATHANQQAELEARYAGTEKGAGYTAEKAELDRRQAIEAASLAETQRIQREKDLAESKRLLDAERKQAEQAVSDAKITAMNAAGATTPEGIIAANVAEENAKKAEERLAELDKSQAAKRAGINRELYQIGTAREVAGIGMQGIESRYGAGTAEAGSQIAQAEHAAQIASVEERKRSKESSFDAQEDQLRARQKSLGGNLTGLDAWQSGASGDNIEINRAIESLTQARKAYMDGIDRELRDLKSRDKYNPASGGNA
jgi:hypothetical protein